MYVKNGSAWASLRAATLRQKLQRTEWWYTHVSGMLFSFGGRLFACSLSLSVCLSVLLSVCLSVYLSAPLSSLSLSLPLSLSLHLPSLSTPPPLLLVATLSGVIGSALGLVGRCQHTETG